MPKSNPRNTDNSRSPYKGTQGIKRLTNATGYSLKGFCAAWQHEAAFRQEALLVTVLIPLACFVTENSLERLLLVGSLLIVLLTELLNSALETVVDRISYEHHELSGRAKDLGSAAVLVSLAIAGITWGIILL